MSADVYMDTGQGAVGTNMYVYCINNPINLIDPEGTLALTITLVTVLTAITIGKGTVLGGSIGNGIANYYDLEGASRIAVIAGGALVGGGATAAVAIGGPAVIAAAAPVVAQQKDNIVNLAAKIGGQRTLDLAQVANQNINEFSRTIYNATRTGQALQTDAFHRAGSYLTQSQLASGQVFNLMGDDGLPYLLLQTLGGVNGQVGVFDFIFDPRLGTITHQLFNLGGSITGNLGGF